MQVCFLHLIHIYILQNGTKVSMKDRDVFINHMPKNKKHGEWTKKHRETFGHYGKKS